MFLFAGHGLCVVRAVQVVAVQAGLPLMRPVLVVSVSIGWVGGSVIVTKNESFECCLGSARKLQEPQNTTSTGDAVPMAGMGLPSRNHIILLLWFGFRGSTQNQTTAGHKVVPCWLLYVHTAVSSAGQVQVWLWLRTFYL